MAPKTSAPIEVPPKVIIRVSGPEAGRWRGGFGTPRKFTPEVQEFSDLTLSAEEIGELQADPELKVEIMAVQEVPKPDQPKPDQPQP